MRLGPTCCLGDHLVGDIKPDRETALLIVLYKVSLGIVEIPEHRDRVLGEGSKEVKKGQK
jgi:hypothetical protein